MARGRIFGLVLAATGFGVACSDRAGGHADDGAGSPRAGRGPAEPQAGKPGGGDRNAAGSGTGGIGATASAGWAGEATGPDTAGKTAGGDGTVAGGGAGGRGGEGGRLDAGSAGTPANGGNSAGTTCAPPPPRCPSKVLESETWLVAGEQVDAATFTGITEIRGDLTVVASATGLAPFDCLESISGVLELKSATSVGVTFAGAFPNLVSARSIDVDNFFGAPPVDCAFQSLESARSLSLTHVSGAMDLSRLRDFNQLFVRANDLWRLVLPNDGSFAISQLQIALNPSLSDLAGFRNVKLTGAPGLTSPYFSLQIENNPRLTGCRVLEIAQVFQEAGYVPGGIVVGMPTCP